MNRILAPFLVLMAILLTACTKPPALDETIAKMRASHESGSYEDFAQHVDLESVRKDFRVLNAAKFAGAKTEGDRQIVDMLVNRHTSPTELGKLIFDGGSGINLGLVPNAGPRPVLQYKVEMIGDTKATAVPKWSTGAPINPNTHHALSFEVKGGEWKLVGFKR